MSFNVSLAFIVACVIPNILIQVRGSLKSEVESVPGLIFPIFINRVCMLRQHYDCRWTYEKSCNCNPLRRKDLRRILQVTFYRIKTKANKKAPIDIDECGSGEDKCIKF